MMYVNQIILLVTLSTLNLCGVYVNYISKVKNKKLYFIIGKYIWGMQPNLSDHLNLLDIVAYIFGYPDGLVGKESACNAGETGDAGLIPGSGRSLGEVNGNPLQYSCLGNLMDRGALGAAVHGGVTRSQT